MLQGGCHGSAAVKSLISQAMNVAAEPRKRVNKCDKTRLARPSGYGCLTHFIRGSCCTAVVPACLLAIGTFCTFAMGFVDMHSSRMDVRLACCWSVQSTWRSMPEVASFNPRHLRDFGPCKVVILAGGLGTRLAERTDELPKPMVEIGTRPILWHILKGYSHYGFNDFVIAAGYRSDVIKRFFFEYRRQTSDLVFDFTSGAVDYINTRVEPWRIAVIETGESTMTGGRLRRLRDVLFPPLPKEEGAASTFLMTYGDGLADVDVNALLRFHRAHGKLATFTAVQKPTQYGVPKLEGDRAVTFAEKPQTDGEWINAGFFALETRVLDRISGDQDSFELCTLPQLARDGELMAYRHCGFWHAMDTLRDVRNLNTLWAEGNAQWKIWT